MVPMMESVESLRSRIPRALFMFGSGDLPLRHTAPDPALLRMPAGFPLVGPEEDPKAIRNQRTEPEGSNQFTICTLLGIDTSAMSCGTGGCHDASLLFPPSLQGQLHLGPGGS